MTRPATDPGVGLILATRLSITSSGASVLSPSDQAAHAFGDLVDRGRVGEAHVGVRFVVAVVEAGDGGDAGLFEEAVGEAHAVAVERVAAGVDVEGALGHDGNAEAGGP